jgi:hypothetical protein
MLATAPTVKDEYIIDLPVKDRFYLNANIVGDLYARREEFGFGLLGASAPILVSCMMGDKSDGQIPSFALSKAF